MRLRRIATLVGGMIAAVAALAGTAAVGFAVAHRAMVSRGPVVMTAQGKVRGLATRTTDEFLGVPYAAPPVGRLRWRAPQPGQTPWPAYDGNTNSGAVMSLRPAGASVVIPSSQFGAEHECSFWDHPSSMSPVR